jgi:hypothetical protein
MALQPAKFPALGFDTDTQLNAGLAEALAAAGLTFAVRYLSIGAAQPADLSADEAATILRAGLALMAVQHPRLPNWMPSADLGAYVNAWAQAMKSGGYDPGLYVGSGTPLDGTQLYALSVDRYWKSLSQVSEPTCGWSMIQLYPETTIAGVLVDVDVIQQDYKGRVPSWYQGQ